MEKAIDAVFGIAFPERLAFLLESMFFLALTGGILYLLIVATYPPIHDALHDFRHALAVVPCH